MKPSEIFFNSYLEEAKLEAFNRLKEHFKSTDLENVIKEAMTGKFIKKSMFKDEEDIVFLNIDHYYSNSLKIDSYLKKFLPDFKKFLKEEYGGENG